MSGLVEVSDVWKTFTVNRSKGVLRRERQRVQALAGVSFSIQPGEVVGYLGPNGAGKSTTVKLLTGIITPTSGSIEVRGLNPFENRAILAYHAGTMFGQRSQLWWDLPVSDSFHILRSMYGLPIGRFRSRIAFLVDAMDLGRLLDVPVRQLSLGQRVRCELAAALLHEPSLLFLDEPTIGLDFEAKDNVRSVLRYLNESEDLTIIVTSHDLADIQKLCKRLIVIDEGAIISDGNIDVLLKEYDPYRRLVVDLEEAHPPLEVDGAVTERVVGVRQWLRFHRDVTSASRLVASIAEQVPIRDLSIEEPGIEELVRAIYATRGLRPRRERAER